MDNETGGKREYVKPDSRGQALFLLSLSPLGATPHVIYAQALGRLEKIFGTPAPLRRPAG